MSADDVEMDRPLTAGEIRAAMAGVPDDAEAFAGVVRGGDLAIVAVIPTRMIPWADYDAEEVTATVEGVEFVVDEPSRRIPDRSLADLIARRLALRCPRSECTYDEPMSKHRAEAAIAVGVVAEWLHGHGEADDFLRGTFDALAREARNGST